MQRFEIGTKDVAGVLWSADDTVLAIWDSSTQYKIFIYTPSGHCLASYSAYDWALGIKCVTWSPSSQFLAIASYDNKVRNFTLIMNMDLRR